MLDLLIGDMRPVVLQRRAIEDRSMMARIALGYKAVESGELLWCGQRKHHAPSIKKNMYIFGAPLNVFHHGFSCDVHPKDGKTFCAPKPVKNPCLIWCIYICLAVELIQKS